MTSNQKTRYRMETLIILAFLFGMFLGWRAIRKKRREEQERRRGPLSEVLGIAGRDGRGS